MFLDLKYLHQCHTNIARGPWNLPSCFLRSFPLPLNPCSAPPGAKRLSSERCEVMVKQHLLLWRANASAPTNPDTLAGGPDPISHGRGATLLGSFTFEHSLTVVSTQLEVLEYIRSLGIEGEALLKLVNSFPEVLGCSKSMKAAVLKLKTDWKVSCT